MRDLRRESTALRGNSRADIRRTGHRETGNRYNDLSRVVPIQVKARTTTCYAFDKRWFCVPNLVPVQVWLVTSSPVFYVFGGIDEVEDVLGPRHTHMKSWLAWSVYNVTKPNADQLARMKTHESKWERIRRLLDKRP